MSQTPTYPVTLLDENGFNYAMLYLLTKLANSPLAVNTTYGLSLDTENERIVLTDNDGNTSYVSYSDFGEANVLESISIGSGSALPISNKNSAIPMANGTSGSETDGAMSSSDKAKLDGIAAGAQVNVVEGAQADGSDLTIVSKKIQIPTAGANTRGLISNADVNTLISTALEAYKSFTYIKVTAYSALPVAYSSSDTYAVGDYCTHNDLVYVCNTAISTAEAWDETHWTFVSNLFGTIFLVPSGGTTPNIYDEYAWMPINTSTTPITYGYEKIGSTSIDLSGYVRKTDISLLDSTEIANAVDDAYDAVFNPTTP